ncbi:hypothetical protein ACO0LM_10675 [Undibacterium sp. Di26W]|uniref:hypothetical protein n=1 Tax=Undibacterium sp. Di26W TaxID=3413035 RepID=UPI003BF157F1
MKLTIEGKTYEVVVRENSAGIISSLQVSFEGNSREYVIATNDSKENPHLLCFAAAEQFKDLKNDGAQPTDLQRKYITIARNSNLELPLGP